MENSARTLHDKVIQLFSEIAPDDSDQLDFFIDSSRVEQIIVNALTHEMKQADDLAYHLSDIRADAAFLVALHLFPDRFTSDEVSAGVWQFLTHVPYHIQKAAEIAVN